MNFEPALIDVIVFLMIVIGGVSFVGGWFTSFFQKEGSLRGKGYVDQAALWFIRPARFSLWGGLVLLVGGLVLLLVLVLVRSFI